jgi:hypothetical protein
MVCRGRSGGRCLSRLQEPSSRGRIRANPGRIRSRRRRLCLCLSLARAAVTASRTHLIRQRGRIRLRAASNPTHSKTIMSSGSRRGVGRSTNGLKNGVAGAGFE